MERIKRIFFILVSLALLVLFVLFLYVIDFEINTPFKRFLNNPSIKSFLQMAIIIFILSSPLFIFNSITLNIILLFKQDLSNSLAIENSFILEHKFNRINKIQISNIIYSLFGFIMCIICFGVLIAFFLDNFDKSSSEDIIFLSIFASVGIIGSLIVLDSIFISKRLRQINQ